MKDGLLKPYHPSTQLFILLVIAFGTFILLGLLGQSLLEPVWGINISSNPEAIEDYSDPNVISARKFLGLLNQLGMFLIPALVFGRLASHKGDDYLTLGRKPNWIMLASIVILIMAVVPISNGLQAFNSQLKLSEDIQKMQNANFEVIAALTSGTRVVDLLINLFLMALIPALGEELLFRGIIMRLLARVAQNIHAGIWVTGLLFSLMHGQPHNFIPMLLLGVLFGYLLIWSGTIWVPIAAHFLFNASTIFITFLVNRGDIIPESHTFGAEDVALLLTGIVITGALIYYYIRKSRWKELEYHFMKH